MVVESNTSNFRGRVLATHLAKTKAASASTAKRILEAALVRAHDVIPFLGAPCSGICKHASVSRGIAYGPFFKLHNTRGTGASTANIVPMSLQHMHNEFFCAHKYETGMGSRDLLERYFASGFQGEHLAPGAQLLGFNR